MCIRDRNAFVHAQHVVPLSLDGEGVEQRQVVIRGGRRHPAERVLEVADEVVVAPLGNALGDPGVELRRPGGDRRILVPIDDAEVVDDVAAADDQHALVAQRGETAAEGVVPVSYTHLTLPTIYSV